MVMSTGSGGLRPGPVPSWITFPPVDPRSAGGSVLSKLPGGVQAAGDVSARPVVENQLVIRMGREQLVCVLPGEGSGAAGRMLADARAESAVDPLPLTFRAGIAQLGDAETVLELVARAKLPTLSTGASFGRGAIAGTVRTPSRTVAYRYGDVCGW
jgi:hypothetical protein